MRKGFKHGKWVKAPVPHADISKYVDRQTGKEDDDKPGSRFRKEGSTMEFKKRRSAGRGAAPKGPSGKGPSGISKPPRAPRSQAKYKEIKVSNTQTGLSKGRKKFQHGGRTRLLEELGRVEAEPSNRNRRAEISRVHGELNRGYKHGKRVKKQHGGSAQSHYVQHGYGPHRSSGKVLKGKKVGIQIK